MLALRINRALPIGRLCGEMDGLFENLFEGFPKRVFGSSVEFPAINVWEDSDNVFVEAELPGLKLDDIELLIMGDELTIKGERKDVAGEDDTFYRRERVTGSFSRTFTLPVDSRTDDVTAALRNGILLITLPKAEVVKPRKIEVQSV